MSSLMDKLKKAGSVKASSILSKSIFFVSKETIPTDLPILNVAFSGDIQGGLTAGVTIFAGQSKCYKSFLAIFAMKAYMDKYPDSIVLFYDSEFGIPVAYMESMGIDLERIIHIPVTNLEELKFDMVKRLEDIERGDKVFIMVDSIGNMASKREVDNALAENSAADMTRAKEMKSFFRIITPHITMKDLPCVIINHTYKEQGCLKFDTKIVTSNGILPISELKSGMFVATPTGYQEISDVISPDRIDTNDKEYYKITLEDGSEIFSTGNHEFLCEGVWKRCDSLKPGDSMSSK